MHTRETKAKFVEEISGDISNSKALILLNFKGLNFRQTTDLRKNLRKKDSNYRVVKNRLMKLALKENNIDKLDELLVNETSVAFVYNDMVEIAKEIKQFLRNKENEALRIKGAYYNGECYTGEEVLKIADLPNREELLSRLVLNMKSPVLGLVFLLNNIMLNFINVLNAIKDKKTK